MSDIHPHDLDARLALRDQLHHLRNYYDLSGEAVARLAGFSNPGAVRSLERDTSWEAWRVQQWARGLKHTLRLDITGITVAVDDVASLVLKATTAFGFFDEDRLHLRAVAGDLIRSRKAAGVRRASFASACGVDEAAIRGWERRPEMSLLRTYQRYCRALGGVLDLGLRPVEVQEVAA